MTVYNDNGSVNEDQFDQSSTPSSFNERFQGMPINVDRSYQVPYISGMSNDNSTVYIDKSVPKEATVSYKTFDPAIPLALHERTEKMVMDHLIKDEKMPAEKAYEIAHHGFAQPVEDNWYRQNGIDINEMDKFWQSIDRNTEREVKPSDTPPDLYTKPYPHGEVSGTGKTDSMSSFNEELSPQVQKIIQRGSLGWSLLGAAMPAVGAVAGALTTPTSAGESTEPQWWQRESAIKPQLVQLSPKEEESFTPSAPPVLSKPFSDEQINAIKGPQAKLQAIQSNAKAQSAFEEAQSKYTQNVEDLKKNRLQYIKGEEAKRQSDWEAAYARDLEFKQQNEGFFQKHADAASYLETLGALTGGAVGAKVAIGAAGTLHRAVQAARKITTSSKNIAKGAIDKAVAELEARTGDYSSMWKTLGAKLGIGVKQVGELAGATAVPTTLGTIVPSFVNMTTLPESSPYQQKATETFKPWDTNSPLYPAIGRSFLEALFTERSGHFIGAHVSNLQGLKTDAAAELSKLRSMQATKQAASDKAKASRAASKSVRVEATKTPVMSEVNKAKPQSGEKIADTTRKELGQ